MTKKSHSRAKWYAPSGFLADARWLTIAELAYKYNTSYSTARKTALANGIKPPRKYKGSPVLDTYDKAVFNTDKNVRHNIKRWLKRTGRTKSWLAEQLGVSDSYLFGILENGRKIRLELVLRVMVITGMPLSQLVAQQRD